MFKSYKESLAYKIGVMQAVLEGKKVDVYNFASGMNYVVENPVFNWTENMYKVVEEPIKVWAVVHTAAPHEVVAVGRGWTEGDAKEWINSAPPKNQYRYKVIQLRQV